MSFHKLAWTIALVGIGGCAAPDATSIEDQSPEVQSAEDVHEIGAAAPDPAAADRLQKLIDAAADLGVGGTDRDGDGIADVVEERLLRQYRPYYHFTKGEARRPIDALDLVKRASLRQLGADGEGASDALPCKLDVPDALLSCRPDSSYATKAAKTRYCLELPESVDAGASFATVKAEGTGLYGHVAKDTVGGHPAYKVEYWQVFGFNDQDIGVPLYHGFGDHEGDWTSVQVWYDQTDRRLAKILYLIHGKSITFDVPASATPSCRSCFVELKGPAYDVDLGNFFDDAIRPKYDDNAAELWIDEAGDKHVSVYIERGGHEFWPGPWGHADIDVDLPLVGKTTIAHLNGHAGDGDAFLVPDQMMRPYNVGEVLKPLSRAARTLLQYNGYWGCTNRDVFGNTLKSPIGPAAHCSWKWPDTPKPLAGCEH